MNNLEQAKMTALDERTCEFAQNVRVFVKKLPRTIANKEDIRQLVRTSGAVGASYVKAREAMSKREFVLRNRMCRRLARESRYWLRLVSTRGLADLNVERDGLIQESAELMNLFSNITEFDLRNVRF